MSYLINEFLFFRSAHYRGFTDSTAIDLEGFAEFWTVFTAWTVSKDWTVWKVFSDLKNYSRRLRQSW